MALRSVWRRAPRAVGVVLVAVVGHSCRDRTADASGAVLPPTVDCAQAVDSLAEVVIPGQDEWTDRGTIIRAGAPGSWNARLNGMISPSALVKKDGVFFLYYLGASGDRRDGGPANRKLGVAISEDGIRFREHEGNPILTHAAGVDGCDECGIFSAGGRLAADGTILLYYGAMEEHRRGLVDGDIALASSSNGLDFTLHGDVWTHEQSGITRGDEAFAVGTFAHDGTCHVYFIEAAGAWDLWRADGGTPSGLRADRQILAIREIRGAGNVVWLSNRELLVPLLVDPRARQIELRTTTVSALDTLGPPEEVYEFGDLRNFVLHLDRDLATWFLYYLESEGREIRVRTAPVRFAN